MPDLSTAPVEGLLEPVPPEPAGAQARLFDGVLGALGYVASERPFALIIEDIHWVDGSTRDLVRFLVRNWTRSAWRWS